MKFIINSVIYITCPKTLMFYLRTIKLLYQSYINFCFIIKNIKIIRIQSKVIGDFMENKQNYEEKTLYRPNNINLPFFAYGIFKPGQLAHSKIRNHIYDIKNVEIHYPMKLRDGVPILIDRKSNQTQTQGCIITFRRGQETETYDIIRKTLLRKLYEWKTIKINGNDCNVVFGVNPENGSNYIDDPDERVNFDGKNDPLFSDAIKLIEENLKSNKFSWNMEPFFQLQMNYMLLWSAIDRFSSLKYNRPSKNKNNEKFANEKAFKEGIKRYAENYHMPVYSTEDLKIHKFNAEDATETIKYYYTFRCNIVHRGKGMPNDYNMLKTATEELLEIFKEILKNAFN